MYARYLLEAKLTMKTILMSEETYDNLIETAELLSIPGFKVSIKKAEQEIKKGEWFTLEEVFKV